MATRVTSVTSSTSKKKDKTTGVVGNSSGSSSSGKKNNGNYDPNKDYAAAINVETDPVKKQQLIAERQNKIDAMNAAGTNTKGYTNDIYTNSGSSASSSSGKNNGYYDPNKDYAAAINVETDPVKKQQLIAERQNKIDAMNAAGTNTHGYTNDIYTGGNANSGATGTPNSFGEQKVPAKGIYQNQDTVLNNAALNTQQQTLTNQAMENMSQTATQELDAIPTVNYEQALAMTTDPVQRAALQAYYTRMKSNLNPNEVQGTYAGDTSMSLPDQALIVQYQTAYNQAKKRGDTAAMKAAHQMAEKVRDNYRYYPLAKSNGYHLGENDIGYIRDIVVRVDNQGNKYVDQYNQGTVTTTKYDKDGNFVNRLKGADINMHDNYVANQWDRADASGKDYTAIRVADANDVNLSVNDLIAKYGAQAGMGKELYTDARVNSKIPNGRTLASMMTANGQGGEVVANAVNQGYFDPDKDYAEAIQNAASTQEMLQLQQERQNKINWLNQTGQNPNGYTNEIYANYQNIQNTMHQQTMQPVSQTMPEYQGMSKNELLEGYNDAAAKLEKQRNELLNLTLSQNQAAQNTANTEYDELARQAYILKRQQEMTLPQQLAAMGISGGGSETANLQLMTNYQNNLNQNEQARQKMLKDFALQSLQAQTQANSDIAGYYADAQQAAMNAWQNEQANQNSWNQWAANYQQGLREYQDQMNNLAYNQIQSNKEQQINLALQMGDYNKLAALGYDASYLQKLQNAELEQQQINLALQLGDYNRLAALGYDTSYLQRLQNAELEQIAMAANKSRSSSGGGSYSGGGYSGDDVETDVVLGNNSSQLTKNGYTHLVMNYKLLGDTEAFEQKVNELMNNGSVSQADYEKFLKAYS